MERREGEGRVRGRGLHAQCENGTRLELFFFFFL